VQVPVAPSRGPLDTEAFTSLEDFKNHVTSSALNWFDNIEIRVGESDPLITISFVRRVTEKFDRTGPPACPWLPRGVLVQVGAMSEEAQSLAPRALDSVVRALARGGRKITDVTVGKTWAGEDPKAAVERALKERGRTTISARLRSTVIAFSVFWILAVLLTDLLGDFPLHHERASSGSSGGAFVVDGWFVVLWVLTIPFGWFISAPLIRDFRSSWAQVAIRENGPLPWRVTQRLAGSVPATVAGVLATYLLAKAGIKAK
jgi:hypothetical protein